jgi:septum formation protein
LGAQPLILASSSPRRQSLLHEAGYEFEVVPPHVSAEDEPRPGESPQAVVARLAWQKAADVVHRVTAGTVLGCDTVADCDGVILGKPVDRADARRILELLRGREHRVLTGVCLWPVGGEPLEAVAETRLLMAPLTDDALDEYLASGLWQGKAGAFGYQDRLGWLDVVEGSESNVVGLPLELLATMLHRLCGSN